MERVEVEAFAQDTNAWIIRTPGRQFPALVLQGDSFSRLVGLAQSILERARACNCADEELAGECKELRDLLWGRLQRYEEVLHERGLTLPYNRVGWPK